MIKEKLIVKTKSWSHTCGDGCCYTFGTDIYINEERVSTGDFNDIDLILNDVLQKLGYEIEIEYCDD